MQMKITPNEEVCQNVRKTTETDSYCFAGEEDCGINPLWSLSVCDIEEHWDLEDRRFVLIKQSSIARPSFYSKREAVGAF